jgi:hypothetical protein
MELRRQEEEINWGTTFLRAQQRLLSPVQFLELWKSHNRVRVMRVQRFVEGSNDSSSNSEATPVAVLENVYPGK